MLIIPEFSTNGKQLKYFIQLSLDTKSFVVVKMEIPKSDYTRASNKQQ